MKKIFAISIISILAISVLIFPAVAAVTANSVSWDAYPEWKNQYQVRGYVEIFSYTGSEPMACIVGQTNTGAYINATAYGVESARSSYQDCNLQGTIPLLDYWNSYCLQ